MMAPLIPFPPLRLPPGLYPDLVGQTVMETQKAEWGRVRRSQKPPAGNKNDCALPLGQRVLSYKSYGAFNIYWEMVMT